MDGNGDGNGVDDGGVLSMTVTPASAAEAPSSTTD